MRTACHLAAGVRTLRTSKCNSKHCWRSLICGQGQLHASPKVNPAPPMVRLFSGAMARLQPLSFGSHLASLMFFTGHSTGCPSTACFNLTSHSSDLKTPAMRCGFTATAAMRSGNPSPITDLHARPFSFGPANSQASITTSSPAAPTHPTSVKNFR